MKRFLVCSALFFIFSCAHALLTEEFSPKYLIFETPEELGAFCADQSIARIENNNRLGQRTVLGLPTGSTFLPLYREFRKKCYQKNVDLSNVTTFNTHEYIGLDSEHPQSFHYFMFAELFYGLLYSEQNKKGIKEENIHIPSGWACSLDDLTREEKQALNRYFPARGYGKKLDPKEQEWMLKYRAAEYEKLIEEKGPIDIQLLGIGENGHIGYAEPGASHSSSTSVFELAHETRQANSRFFNGCIKEVPKYAISIGVGTILRAKEIILLATGNRKADAVRKSFLSPISDEIPSTALRTHPRVLFLIDKEAASKLNPQCKEVDFDPATADGLD